MVANATCVIDTQLTMKVNDTTNAFFFVAHNGQVVPNFKAYFPGLDMLGKHYTVSNVVGDKVKRHYTICNVMQPKVYSTLVNHLKQGKTTVNEIIETSSTTSGESSSRKGDLTDLLQTVDTNRMMFVIKNYNQPFGLSQKFFTSPGSWYEVKGPMGKSLNVQSTGTHFAFAAGTGVLPFMDLIAQLAFYNLGMKHLLGSKTFEDGFKLKFYVSFQSRKDAIGLELLEALQDFCKKHLKDNFELNLRISNEGKQRRWDSSFIEEQLKGFNSISVPKVWVCGPPVMSETFDKTFDAIKTADPARFGTGVLEVL